MPIAFIKVREMKRQDRDFIKFGGAEGKIWNCNKPELFSLLTPESCIKIDYSESQPSDPSRKPSKYINQARPMQPGEQLTWPDKEPYQGGGGGFKPSSDGKKNDYDPEVGKRQTAANCAANYLARQNLTVEDFKNAFPQIADAVYAWVNEAPKSDAGAAPEPTNEFDAMMAGAKAKLGATEEAEEFEF